MRSANLSEAAKSQVTYNVNVCCVQGSKCLQTCVNSSLHTTTGIFMQDAVYEHTFSSVLIECGDLPAAPLLASKERSLYRSVCNNAKQETRKVFTVNDKFSSPPPFFSLQPCSNQTTMHYSFDMAQQVHYPSDPLQPGPIYFLTPRKCALFGVCCEPSHGRLTTSSTRRWMSGRGRTPSSACSTTSLTRMALERCTSIRMLITVWVRTKTTR